MNIFEAIRKDHDIQRNLLDKLVDTSGDTEQRSSIFKELKHELRIHANSEERHFYKPLIPVDMMQEHARHGIAEHHEIDELLEQLEDTEQDSSGWLKIAKNLKEKVEHHLEDEEHTFFQLAGKAFTDTQKQELASKYNAHMQEQR
ncbi:MAG: hemerythrin domain-containing protein [Winogradskyella sp.]|uniref:hemerythrin domain-containing protein n=1 Tax=Winogradskyella sp. TaxID=1883156 RepID=UPI00185605CD|nr:hemerythrin domain-containing protein [Winogradskyella sp.]